jgi:hypothetical protein
MGGNLPPLVRAFRDRNRPSAEPVSSRSVSTARPLPKEVEVADPASLGLDPPPAAGEVAVRSQWPKFPHEMGYADRLRANAAVLSKLILMASRVVITAADIWKDRWPDAPLRLGPAELQTIQAEAAVVCFGFVEEMAEKYMLPLDKGSLIDKLPSLVAEEWAARHGVDGADFTECLRTRCLEQADRPERSGTGEERGYEAILRDCASRIARTVGVGDSRYFTETVSNLFRKHLARWGIADLLRR